MLVDDSELGTWAVIQGLRQYRSYWETRVILPSRPKVYRKDTKVAVFVAVVLSSRPGAHELKASFLASS